MKTLIGRPLHTAFRLCKNIDEGEQPIGRMLFCRCGQIGPESFREALASGIRAEADDDQGSDGENQLPEELGEVLSAFELLMDDFQSGWSVPYEQSVQERGNGFPGGKAEDIEDIGLNDLFSAKGDELIQHRLRVAHPAVRSFSDGPGGGFLELQAFFCGDVKKVF